jgi:hypothetical protein
VAQQEAHLSPVSLTVYKRRARVSYDRLSLPPSEPDAAPITPDAHALPSLAHRPLPSPL